MKVNLGCGHDKRPGWLNVDSRKDAHPDLVADLEKKLPIESNAAEEIALIHVVEHVTDPISLIDECYRILKKGGKLEVVTPHVSTFQSIGELDHKRAGLSVFSFHYTTNLHAGNRHYYAKARFKINKVRIITNPIVQFLADLSPIKYELYLSRFFGAREIRFELEKE